MSTTTGEDTLDRTLLEEREIMDGFAPHYRRWNLTGSLVYRRERSAFVAWMLETLRRAGCAPVDLRYLDVGCGTGEVLEGLAGAGCGRLTGLDLSDRMLAETRVHVPGARLVRGAIERHAFEPGSFDVIAAAFTVHHLLEPEAFFAAAERWLAPGGWIFVLEYNRDSWSYTGGVANFAIRLVTLPLRLFVRWKNRRAIAAQPQVPSRFNQGHAIRGIEEIRQLARAHGFEPQSLHRGMLRPRFLLDVFEESSFDRVLIAALGAVEDMACPPHARAFHWMTGRRRVA